MATPKCGRKRWENARAIKLWLPLVVVVIPFITLLLLLLQLLVVVNCFCFLPFIALPIWWNCSKRSSKLEIQVQAGHVAASQHQTNRLTAPQNRLSAVLCINLSTDLRQCKNKRQKKTNKTKIKIEIRRKTKVDINHKLTNIAHTDNGSGSLAWKWLEHDNLFTLLGLLFETSLCNRWVCRKAALQSIISID